MAAGPVDVVLLYPSSEDEPSFKVKLPVEMEGAEAI